MAVTTTYSLNQDVSGFFMNTLFTAGSQSQPAVIGLADGGYFGAWTQPDVPAGSTQGVLAQIVNANGSLRGGNFVANFTTALDQFNPSLAQLSNGNIVAIYTDTSTGMAHIRARLFNTAGGGGAGDAVIDGGYFNNSQEADVTATGFGFVVSYTSDFGGGDKDIRFARFDVNGALLGGASVGVDTTVALNTNSSSVASLTSGIIVVAFEQSAAGGGPTSVFYSLFNSVGAPIGAKVLIDATGSINRDIQVAALQDGGFAVAYTDNGWAGSSGTEITAKVFNADGSDRSSFLMANFPAFGSTETGNQDKPTITVLSNGYFLVGWTDEPNGLAQYQAFDPSGNKIGSRFDGNTSVVEDEIAALKNGFFATVRESSFTDGSGDSIRSSIWNLQRTSTGDAAADTITGDDLVDVMMGAGGDDTLRGNGGNDSLDGGTGINTAVYAGSLAAYTITRSGLITTVVDNHAGSPEGTDTLTNIEFLKFADGTIVNAAVQIDNITTAVSTISPGTPYTGPVAGLVYQYIDLNTNNLNLTGLIPNGFLHSGSGFDAIDVSHVNGTNVLDGGTNSNFLVGGTAAGSFDTFFVDNRSPPGDIWSTVVNFHAGDNATVWGVTQAGFNLAFANGEGAPGFTGLTLHVTKPGVPTASLTLTGFSTADLTNGKLSTSFGNVGGADYFFVHGN